MQEIFDKANAVLAAINDAKPSTADELEAFRIQYLGTKNVLKDLFGAMAQLPGDRKKEYGQLMNTLKAAAEAKYEEQKNSAGAGAKASVEIPDLTAPGYSLPLGSRHPISIVKNKMIDIFSRIGFTVAEGPEIEDDWHNFTALGTPRITQLVICRIPFKIKNGCYAHTPHRCKCV
jgi:phenylalanyl-tRNA synthetase alpha chain